MKDSLNGLKTSNQSAFVREEWTDAAVRQR